MAKRRNTGSTAAIMLLQDSGVEFVSHTFDPGQDHFGAHAAAALAEYAVQAEQIFKTLLIERSDAGARRRDGYAIACIPVTATLSLKKAAGALGWGKAEMADARHAQAVTGYIPGGVSPLGLKQSLPVLLDASVVEWGQVFVSGGKRGLDVGLAPADLVALTHATVVEIVRG